MSTNTDIDPVALLASLNISGVVNIRSVTGGQDLLIWHVEYDGKSHALRLFRADQHEPARREAVALRAAASVAPVPQIITQGMWQNRPVVLMEWCEGETLLHYLLQHPENTNALGIEFGRLHARINQIPAPSDLAPPNVMSDFAGWLDPALAARLRTLPAQPPALLHLDYHPLNVLTDGSRITAVLDWVNVMPGDPRADFARTVAVLRVSPIQPPVPPELRQLRRSFERAWRQGYLEVAGQLSDLPLFYAFAGEAMEPEYAPRLANPNHWIQESDLTPMRRWTRYWRHCAGISNEFLKRSHPGTSP